METRKTVLFPTDFSDLADEALETAVNFIHSFADKLIIYHVYHRPVAARMTKRSMDSLLRKLEIQVEEDFKLLASEHKYLKKINYETRKELGISLDRITDFVKTHDIDLIIMGTKGATGFGELWGTKTAQIIKSVQVPVLVLPKKSTLEGITKIGLACDYSQETSSHQLEFLLNIAEWLQLDVDVITLNHNENTMTRQEIANRENVRKILQDVNVSFNFTFSDNVEEGLIDYCKTNEIGLISILPKSYNFIERAFHESLTTKMAFHSPIPLLVLKDHKSPFG